MDRTWILPALALSAVALTTPALAKECVNGKVVASMPPEGYTAPEGVATAQAKPEGNGHVDIAQAKPEGNGHVDLASAKIGDPCH